MPRRTNTQPRTAKRSIYFYRAINGFAPSGEPLPVDVDGILEELQAFRQGPESRYVDQSDGNVLSVAIDTVGSRDRLRFARIRRWELPLMEDAGQLSPLDLPESAGLYEPIHMAFFDNNIVGVEFNFYGPRPSRFPTYLRALLPDNCADLRLEALLRQDVLEELQRLRALRVLDLRIRSSYARTVEQSHQALGAAFRAAMDVGQPETIQLVLRPEPINGLP